MHQNETFTCIKTYVAVPKKKADTAVVAKRPPLRMHKDNRHFWGKQQQSSSKANRKKLDML